MEKNKDKTQLRSLHPGQWSANIERYGFYYLELGKIVVDAWLGKTVSSLQINLGEQKYVVELQLKSDRDMTQQFIPRYNTDIFVFETKLEDIMQFTIKYKDEESPQKQRNFKVNDLTKYETKQSNPSFKSKYTHQQNTKDEGKEMQETGTSWNDPNAINNNEVPGNLYGRVLVTPFIKLLNNHHNVKVHLVERKANKEIIPIGSQNNTIQVKIRYYPKQTVLGKLTVMIHKGNLINNPTQIGQMSAFVKLSLDNQSQITKQSLIKGMKPEWATPSVQFTVHSPLQFLKLEVLDKFLVTDEVGLSVIDWRRMMQNVYKKEVDTHFQTVVKEVIGKSKQLIEHMKDKNYARPRVLARLREMKSKIRFLRVQKDINQQKIEITKNLKNNKRLLQKYEQQLIKSIDERQQLIDSQSGWMRICTFESLKEKIQDVKLSKQNLSMSKKQLIVSKESMLASISQIIREKEEFLSKLQRFDCKIEVIKGKIEGLFGNIYQYQQNQRKEGQVQINPADCQIENDEKQMLGIMNEIVSGLNRGCEKVYEYQSWKCVQLVCMDEESHEFYRAGTLDIELKFNLDIHKSR